MKRIAFLACIVLVASGCASHGGYRYVDTAAGAGDYYYDGVGYRELGYGCPGFSTFDYYPYHSLFWGLRSHYYAPFYAPGFHYGVTWFPCGWFAYPTGHRYTWSYLAYSPWRYSFWDAYFFWQQPLARDRATRGVRGLPPRFGSARNEAERVAQLRAAAAAKTTAQGRARAVARQAVRSGAAERAATPRGSAAGVRSAPAPRSPSRAPSTMRSERPAPPTADAATAPVRGSWRAQPGSTWSDAGRLEPGSRSQPRFDDRTVTEARSAWPTGADRARQEVLPAALSPGAAAPPVRARFQAPTFGNERGSAPVAPRSVAPAGPARAAPMVPAAPRHVERPESPARGKRESERR